MQETRETRVQSLGQEDLLEEGTATHSSILAGRTLWTEEPGGLQSIGSQRVGHDWSDLAQHSTHNPHKSFWLLLLLLLLRYFSRVRLCNPMDCSLPGSSFHGDSPGKNTGVGCHTLLQRIFSTQGLNPVFHTAGGFFTIWATSEASYQICFLYQCTKNPFLYTCSHQHFILSNFNFNWYNGWKFFSPSVLFAFPWLPVRLVLLM